MRQVDHLKAFVIKSFWLEKLYESENDARVKVYAKYLGGEQLTLFDMRQ